MTIRHASPDAPEPSEAPPTETPKPTAPPIEDERGPQVPIREPGSNPPERVLAVIPAEAGIQGSRNFL